MYNLYEKIKNGEELRESLSVMRGVLRDKKEGPAAGLWLDERFEEEPEVLLSLLKSEDPKIRKNAALVLGLLGRDECRDALLAAYEKEEQRFVKSAYLLALTGCDCEERLDFFKERRRILLGEKRTAENDKHLREELEALNGLISEYETAKRRRFMGMEEPVDVILTTWKDYRDLTAQQITRGQVSMMGSGMRVREGELSELLSIRTWRELLFCLDVEEISRENGAKELAASNLRELLKRHYEGGAPWRFRIECRGKMNLEERSRFTKKLADGLMMETGGTLLNDTSDYEVELRLIEKKSGGFLPLLKFSGLPDRRFAYRKHSVAASMQPALAAMLVELAKPYLKENARVLDPFCGVGTLLLERNYAVHADTLYGVDLFGPAIKGARENAAIAGIPAHFINKDIRDFRHEYKFDEIITDMPGEGKNRTAHDVEYLYRVLCERAEELLNPGSMLFLYAHDRGYAKRYIRETRGLKLQKEWRISEKEDTWFLAVRYEG